MSGAELVFKTEQYMQERIGSVVAEHDQLRAIAIDLQNPDMSGQEFANSIKSRLDRNTRALTRYFNALELDANLFRYMLFLCRSKDQNGYIAKEWGATPRAIELGKKLIPIALEDIQPGDVHLLMDFAPNVEKATIERVHSHGHTTIVHSKQGSEVLTLGVAQMPSSRDGFGYEKYSMSPSEVLNNGTIRETRFLRPVI